MMQAMIFAAGKGTRLKPLTDTMPKALIEVGGQPLLQRVVLKLKEAGFEHLVVNVHHFANQIVDFLQAHDNFGLDIKISDETSGLLETGGGIRKACPMFLPDAPILIHNVDILSNVDLQKFYTLDPLITSLGGGIPDRRVGATLLVSWRETQRYLIFDKDMLLVGWLHLGTGEVKSPFDWVKVARMPRTVEECRLMNKQATDVVSEQPLLRFYAFSGIHCFSPQLFPLMGGYPEKFSIMDFYLQNCHVQPMRGYLQEDMRLMDVGKLDTLKEAEHFLTTL
ncbi:NTP transferase domain-containing protein [Prevotella sp. A2931]|uniref:NTP transferase domain-containing protein n=1 Tax=Prevotella illustrans TaxID=2800387 RepID=A0ABS3M7Z9_9BACT|nr:MULTISPECIES: sugar phosphate nucleotidyltransferase [Prevotella]MBO1364331.1 NTP transferase domain-containing protein [Prevotella illustrans]PTL25856.1 mannose-1-phosphate guanyltransferase [Prevotella sp. oral taxon 820]